MMKPDLSTTLCGIRMKNPIVTASGTSGYGQELANFTIWCPGRFYGQEYHVGKKGRKSKSENR